jgi:hypothetical protein
MVVGCGGDGGSVKEACEKGCATTAPLKCPNADQANCVAGCEAAASSIPMCKAQAEALIICTGNRPASDFACDSDGEPNLKDGVCDPEGQAVVACVFGGS